MCGTWLVLWMCIWLPFVGSHTFRIMPFGDSLTQGGKGHAYRRDLWHMLNSSGHDFTFVGTEIRVLKTLFPKPTFGVHKSDFEMWHESWAGRRTLEFMRTISVSRFMHHAMPDIVLFNLGTNDAIAGDQPARSAVNIRKVVTEMHQVNPSVTILLSTLIPNYATDGSMRRAKELSRMLPGVVTKTNEQLVKQLQCGGTSDKDPTAGCKIEGRHRHVNRRDREKEMACIEEGARENPSASENSTATCRCRRCVDNARKLLTNATVVLCSVGRGIVRSMLGRDGTHPNQEGNVLIASNWFAALRHILPPPTRPASPRSVNVPVAGAAPVLAAAPVVDPVAAPVASPVSSVAPTTRSHRLKTLPDADGTSGVAQLLSFVVPGLLIFAAYLFHKYRAVCCH
mmetsp:Transcript_3002/g.4719  ORF Transcript_3002/g.4719 Transcript_3002/m.4719 type:complete len:397 (-) Transcript_3002:62-1252(-)